MTVGYIYYSDGTYEEYVRNTGNDESARKSVERGTFQYFEFKKRNYPGYGPVPTRFEVRQNV